MWGTLIGLAGSVYGGYKSSQASSNQLASANYAADRSYEAQMAGLEFQQEVWAQQMADVAELEQMFGPVRDNLNTYYQDMSAEQYELRGKDQIEKQYERSNQNIDAMFSDNGMYKSGQQVGAQVALEAAREESLGTQKQASESRYAQEQMNWLNVGLQQQQAARGMAAGTQQQIGGAYQGMSQSALQSGQMIGNVYGQQAQGWGQFGTGMSQLAGFGLSGGFGNQTSLGGNQNLMPGSNRTWGTGGAPGSVGFYTGG